MMQGPLWFQILNFLLEVLTTLVGGACCLLFYMRWRRMSALHPLGQMALALSDWLRRPLGRLAPADTVDWPSLLGLALLKLGQCAVAALALGSSWVLWPLASALGALKLACTVATAVVVLVALASWVQLKPWLADVAQRLADPLLAPLRRVLPRGGGLDWAPLAAVLGLQVLSYVLGHWQARLLWPAQALGA